MSEGHLWHRQTGHKIHKTASTERTLIKERVTEGSSFDCSLLCHLVAGMIRFRLSVNLSFHGFVD